jgi:predicted neutral ceramidase superfamily lipid hydrolase
MEDVPSEVANNLAGLTKGKFAHLALVDAHNCLSGPTTVSSEKVGALQEAALSSLQLSSESTRGTFKVGVARKIPLGLTIKDGFGPGGISVMGFEVSGHRFAYVGIDGNNMVSRLRERILKSLLRMGLTEGRNPWADQGRRV